MNQISHEERIRTVLAGEKPDRVPVALWRHFPVDDQDPTLLAGSIAAFQREFDFDLVKVTPASSFCLKDWGAVDVWEGNPEGTRRYAARVVQKPKDWQKLQPLDPRKGELARQIQCLKLVRHMLGKEVPILQTVFAPLAQAKNLAGGATLVEHLRRWPDAVAAGLERIVDSTIAFMNACRDAKIDGFFFAVQHASYSLLSAEEYGRWGRAHDLAMMRNAKDLWLNLLHLHGESIMFDLAMEAPVQIINWHDREAGPALKEGFRRTGKAVCGGWRQWQTMAYGDGASLQAEAREAIGQMGGKHLILGTGCVAPVLTPRSNLLAARNVELKKRS